MSELRTYPNPNALARAAAELFVTLASEAIASRGRFAVALSGGSTPKAMHTNLSSPEFVSRVDWARVHIFWGDERCVPPDHEHSSYRMAKETLLDRAPIPPGNVHRIRGEADPEQAAREYEDELRAFFGQPRGGRPQGGQPQGAAPTFDLIFLGMGDDGHTASIFPGTTAIHEQARWVMAQEHNFPPPPLVSRITFTPPILNAAANVVVLVTGAGKAGRLKQVLYGSYQPDILPAQIVKPAHGKLVWMVDEAATELDD